VAMVQWGKTFMTLGQNVLLAAVSTGTRVYISMGVMFVGVLIPPLFIYTLGSTWLGWVTGSYLCIGLALGIFECTYLSVIVPLGPNTKSIAIMGFPAAFAIVNIIGQTLMALFDMPVVIIFWYVALCMPVAFLAFRRICPAEAKHQGKSYKQAGLCKSMSDWKTWVPRMIPFCLVNIVSHFTMESVLPAVFNTFNDHEVPLWGPEDNSYLMKKQWFLVILSICMAVGDMSSRKIGFMFNMDTLMKNYLGLAFALICSVVGLLLTLTGIAALVWFSVALAFFGSGFNYAVTAKYIDRFLPRKHNLHGYSLWMFVGYGGAIAGATLVTLVRNQICKGQIYVHECG